MAMSENLYKEREDGQAAERILTDPIWIEAWTAYRARILELIEGADSHNTETVMHLKRLLTAMSGARGHIERIMKEGAIAAKSIEVEEQRKSWADRVLRRA